MTQHKVIVFGDSILKGVVLDEAQRYRVSDVLGLDQLGERFGLNVENRSRFGCTSGKGFAMLERCLDRGERPDAVLLGYGGNDADFNWEEVAREPEAEHQSHTPLQQFKAQYRAVIGRLKTLGIEPVLMTLPPVCAERYFRWITRAGLDAARILSWLGDVEAIYRYQERYSHALEELARENRCWCADLRDALLQKRQMEQYYCADGIHVNEAGQEVIRNVFSGLLQRRLGRETAHAG